MIYLFRWLFGYVEFSFSGGFKEDFLTECFADGIEIRDIISNDDGFTGRCNIRAYKKLHRYAFKHGGRVKVTKRKGLPFIIPPIKNRVGFFVGMLAFVTIISFLSCFIWNVEIVGNDKISEISISSYLENHNVKPGTMWSSVDRDDICWDIMSEFDDISWAHINKIGTTARVEINETRTAQKTPDTEKLTGANVLRKELSAVAYREQKKITVKETKTYKKLLFFTAQIPLYLNMEKGDISQQSVKRVKIKGVELPLGICEYEEKFLTSSSTLLSDKQLLNLAQKKLGYLERDEFDGFEIINETQSHKIDADKCVVTASYIVKRK